MKITFLQVDEAFNRAVVGEPIRAIARDFGVTEGALRFHFRKGTHPKEIRRIAYALLHAEQALARLDANSRRAVARLAWPIQDQRPAVMAAHRAVSRTELQTELQTAHETVQT